MPPDDDPLADTEDDVMVPCPRCFGSPPEVPEGPHCWLCGGLTKVTTSMARLWQEMEKKP